MIRTLSLIFLLLAMLSGCTQLIFQPSQRHIITPDKIGLSYEDIYFKSLDGLTLHSWWIPAIGKTQATVLYLHGNAQNISNHLGNAYWLPKEGVNLMIVDYRGYGQSEGLPSLEGAMMDIEAALQQTFILTDKSPVIVISHSLGASMSIHAIANSPNKTKLAGAIFVSPFSDYQQIARETVAKVWFFWPFQYPMSWSINNDFSPINSVSQLAPMPQLFLHSPSDSIIPPQHSERLFTKAGEPKQIKMLDGGHNSLFTPPDNRQLILETIRHWSNNLTPPFAP